MYTRLLSPFCLAERSVLRLDGHAILADGIMMGVSELPGLRTRLEATLPVDRNDCVAVMATAAWVHGALTTKPEKVELSGLSGNRLHLSAGHYVTREIALTLHDIDDIGGLMVTHPTRTAVDIARHVPDDNLAHHLLSGLAAHDRCDIRVAIAQCQRVSHVPYTHRALRRLRRHLTHAVDVIDAINTPNGIE